MNEGNFFRFDLWLYNEMVKRGWNKADLARACGLSKVIVGKYMANKQGPTLYSFQKILAALGKHVIIEDN